jgi:alcohol dehydrogenase
LKEPEDETTRGNMLVAAHLAGLAAENAMLGAAHACAEPLTVNYGIPHGTALSLVLARVIEWSEEFLPQDVAAAKISSRLRDLARRSGLPLSLKDANVPEGALPRLSDEAAAQWTGKFSPRKFDAEAAHEIYRAAYV